mgnify:CR=1 FL=1
MKNYQDIGLTPNLISADSLAVRVDNEKQSITNLVTDFVQNLNPNISGKTTIENIMFKHTGTTSLEIYYPAGQMMSNSALGSASQLRNRLVSAPFLSTRGGVIDRIACRVTGGTPSAEFRMGIYKSAGLTQLFPQDLILDAGTFDASTTGVRIGTINVKLEPNTLYWFTHTAGGTANARYVMGTSDDCFAIIGAGTNLGDADYALSQTRTYGTLSNIYPVVNRAGNPSSIPLVGVRFLA